MKIVNVVLGIGTAIIVGSLINLGIAAFHPGPVMPDYSSYVTAVSPAPCPQNDKACASRMDAYDAQWQAEQTQFNTAMHAYDTEMKSYNSGFFVISNIAGIVVFVIGFMLLFAAAVAAAGVPIGIMMAGLWSIIYGYMRGWGSTNDELKFFIGLVIAVIVIGGSMWLVERYQKKYQKKK